ncbi:MAG TPA: 4Fe-4S dicluster domain-containing protein [Phycisphaerae bacterium]|nr:4Fe-4S dicluster domain-containing protein [Phycisphaerae bacterium]HRW55868.1 4Fe-4S dicluster domain-containing protein [Phycisphaerae bacterium]
MSLLTHLLGPRSAFDGGLYLPDRKASLARRPIQTLHPEGPLHVPLTVRRDLPTEPVVRPGDRVVLGQALSRAANDQAVGVHAPCAGTIEALKRVWTVEDGFLPGAILSPDGSNERTRQHQGWDNESIIVQLAENGVVCDTPRAPLHVVMREAISAGVTDLIVNAMETEPYLTADLRTLVEFPGRMIDTTCELADALGVSRAILAVPFRHRRVVRRLQSEAAGRYVEIVALSNPYPQCHPVMLLKAVLDREVAPGASIFTEDAIVLPMATVRRASDALLSDLPTTHALMTVAGDIVEHAGTYRVPIGTRLSDLAKRVGLVAPAAQVIYGGPLTGSAFGYEEAVVTPDSKALLLFGRADISRPVPCVRCGWCVEDCPVGIDPPALMRLETESVCSDQKRTSLRACIECGLCSHVCPSRLPLSETIVRNRIRFTGGDSATEGGTRH